MTVLENVLAAFTKDIKYGMLDSLFRTPRFWKTEKELKAKALDLLSIFHLEDKADYIAANLPYGQQRKLEIARALASRPHFMLLDEPMSHLDERNAAVMAGILLEEVRTNGTGVIVTSVGKRFEIEYDKVFSL